MNERQARREALYFLASEAEHAAAQGGISEDLSDDDEARICRALVGLARELRQRADRA